MIRRLFSWVGSSRRRIGFLTIGLFSAVIAGCLSMRGPGGLFRGPSGEGSLVYDNFSQKGYEEATHRVMQSGRELPPEQIAREMAGREIWYKSAPNGRMHTYVFGQRVNAPIDWYKIMRSDRRGQRFNVWGVMNDPDCCTPGQDCESKNVRFKNRPSNPTITLQDTYGFDFCPGDEELLRYVGQVSDGSGTDAYTKIDPACTNEAVRAADQLDRKNGGIRESSCELAFGTSTGIVGFRKFPNPRFNRRKWEKINTTELAKRNAAWDGAGWEGYSLRDFEGSVEPPFRVGISCASCHASFDPTRPPRDVNHPEWRNISGTVGNQYLQITAMLGSGTKKDSLEQQMFMGIARPGTSDTSAVPNDMVGNPGTINAIINFPQRPTFKDQVNRWFHVDRCDPSVSSCQEVTYKDGRTKKYWHYDQKEMDVFHILKGGEDSVGADLAVQRVYVNIGMCAEQCWVNHHTDIRALDPHERAFGQSPFDIYQCRRDCAPWRANEDRVGDIIGFLLSARPFDLKTALVNNSKITGEGEEADARFQDFLEERYGKGAIQRGRDLFAKNCAFCHSSQNTEKADMTDVAQKQFDSVDFHREVTLPSGEILRADWMGNDKSTSQKLAGTYKCRALHTNHMKNHLWEEFGSETYRAKKSTVNDSKGRPIAGGPGYYRNISLLSAWAFAPFLHNNSVGPEICGRPQDPKQEVHRSTYEGEQMDPVRKSQCPVQFDPTIEGRLSLFDQSLDELLTFDRNRTKKLARADVPILLPLGVDIKSLGRNPKKLYIEFPAGTPVTLIGNFDIKGLVADIFGAIPLLNNESEYQAYWEERVPGGGKEMAAAVRETLGLLNGVKDLNSASDRLDKIKHSIKLGQNPRLDTYVKYYSGCVAGYENVGHNFGLDQNLSAQDRQALKAFLATL